MKLLKSNDKSPAALLAGHSLHWSNTTFPPSPISKRVVTLAVAVVHWGKYLAPYESEKKKKKKKKVLLV